jgi:hypothetical protein
MSLKSQIKSINIQSSISVQKHDCDWFMYNDMV